MNKKIEQWLVSKGQTIRKNDETRIGLWIKDDDDDELVSRVVEELEDRFEEFQVPPEKSGYSVISEMFPGNKNYEWEITRILARVNEDKTKEAEQEKLTACSLSDLAKACGAAVRRWREANHNPAAKGEEVERLQEEYGKLEYAWSLKVREAFKDENLALLNEAVKLSYEQALKASMYIVGKSTGETVLSYLKANRTEEAGKYLREHWDQIKRVQEEERARYNRHQQPSKPIPSDQLPKI